MSPSSVSVRSAVHIAFERAPTWSLRPLIRDQPFGRPFDTFADHVLLTGYRDAVKARRRSNWWSTRILLAPAVRDDLDSDGVALVTDLLTSRTLPTGLDDFAAAASRVASRLPAQVVPTDRIDPRTGSVVFELRPGQEHIGAVCSMYRSFATNLRLAVERAGGRIEGARVLDVGTGSGYLPFALAGAGAREAVGLDVAVTTEAPQERAAVRSVLAGDRAAAVTLVEGDVHALPFEDASFDAVCSGSAVEHFEHARLAMREMARVLRPGGITYHGVDPWFGIHGGHALCTLDFPWGHVRLSESDLVDYLHRLRPHEAEEGVETYRRYFQRPPLTVAESRAAWIEAGFRLVEWRVLPTRTRDPHRAMLDRRVLRDARSAHPSVSRHDLLAVGYTVLALREPARPRSGAPLALDRDGDPRAERVPR